MKNSPFKYDMNCPACQANMVIDVSEDFMPGGLIYVPQSQKKRHSLVEAILNIAIGLGVALVVQLLVFPLFGIQIPMSAHLGIVAIFTAVSVVRSYYVRRLFNYLHVKEIL